MKNAKVPIYKFVSAEGEEVLPPIRRKIAKTMEVTEEFNLYSVYQHLGKMKKAISDREAEIKALEVEKGRYELELKIIEKALRVTDLEESFQREALKEALAKKAAEEKATQDKKKAIEGALRAQLEKQKKDSDKKK